ncbi:hypothetical protein U5922_006430 [Aquicoccus sp. G2-2]|uniref:hypothetical protein n=1 Tax=Aquicoccus sp. G2-2 TaxID=3092120 RepID=UPI002ADFBD2B|nr:hypothetical protein [Aquicoccus sp. G2-2]MEA1113126.1 hypothetical protein [Aquicoccus sp. G2-2]
MLATGVAVLGFGGPVAAASAAAVTCTFTKECYEAEACDTSDFHLQVDLDDKKISTDYGDLTIVAVKEETKFTVMFATGKGAEYLLSYTPTAARMSSQINDGPQVVTYLGKCEELN